MEHDPGPQLIVMADQPSAEEILSVRVNPFLKSCRQLSPYLTGRARDISNRRAILKTMPVYIAWAGSPNSLATRPARRVRCEEVDKYSLWSGKEADAVSLARARTKTYRDRRMLDVSSTPTIRTGLMFKLWDACSVQLHYYVPCGACGAYQMLTWDNLKWPKGEEAGHDPIHLADVVERDRTAFYVCPHCGAVLREGDKAGMLRRGVWATEAAAEAGITEEVIWQHMPVLAARHGLDRVSPWGDVLWTEDAAKSRRIGFHLTGLYSPWTTWSELAVAFLRAQGDPVKMQDFRNNLLGEIYEELLVTIRAKGFRPKIECGYLPGVVPAWATLLLATADTQKKTFWWTLRAWGRGFRSRLIGYGECETFADLQALTLDSHFPVDGHDATLSARRLLIDAGGGKSERQPNRPDSTRTFEVYQFARADPARVLATRGHGGNRPMPESLMMKVSKYKIPGTDTIMNVDYLRMDTQFFKDLLAGRIKAKPDAADAWEVHKDIGDDYVLQLSSEHKVPVRKGSQMVNRWVLVSTGVANHLWDAEYMQCAGAALYQAATLPTLEDVIAQRLAVQQERQRGQSGLQTPDGRPYLISDR